MYYNFARLDSFFHLTTKLEFGNSIALNFSCFQTFRALKTFTVTPIIKFYIKITFCNGGEGRIMHHLHIYIYSRKRSGSGGLVRNIIKLSIPFGREVEVRVR